MSVDSFNPCYSIYVKDWHLCRDSYEGESAIKKKGQAYLPATCGQVQDGMNNINDAGYVSYKNYKEKAVYHNYLSEAVGTAIGMMWSKPPSIELPTAMEAMIDKITPQGESIENLLMRINEEQLITGRLGLLLDLPQGESSSDVLPYVALYKAENIINWAEDKNDCELSLVVLNESDFERTDFFTWDFKQKYRVLTTESPEMLGTYSVGLFEDSNFSLNGLIQPSIRGNTLQNIPFTFINSKDLVSEPDLPPYIDLARLSITIYRGEADYRQSLHLQGQDTLVITGNMSNDDQLKVGAGAVLHLGNNGDAKYIGVDSAGLPEQRLSLENDKNKAAKRTGELTGNRQNSRESAESLKIRLGSQTATLTQIAIAGAKGLENVLRHAAEWLGLNPDEVNIKPNLDFVTESLESKDILSLVNAKNSGLPISKQSLHEVLKTKDLTKLDYETELDLIEEEIEISGGLSEPE